MKRFIIKYFERIQKAHQRNKVKNWMEEGILKVGLNTYGIQHINIDSYKGSEAKVTIGKYCSIAPNFKVITGGIHPIDWVSSFPHRIKLNMVGKYTDGMPQTKGNIEIGNEVWIGTNVTILSGVNIGHGAIILSGSVVTKNVEPYSIIGGVPAKILRKRFDDIQIKKLLEINWWDWEEEKIRENVSLLSSPNIVGFLEKHSR